MKKKLKNTILYDNKGIAMTEVVVAFLLLTIILGLVYSCIRFSSQMTMKATDTDREYEEYSKVMSTKFMDAYGNFDYALGGTNKTITFTDEEGNSVTFETKVADVDVTVNERTRHIHVYSTGN